MASASSELKPRIQGREAPGAVTSAVAGSSSRLRRSYEAPSECPSTLHRVNRLEALSCFCASAALGRMGRICTGTNRWGSGFPRAGPSLLPPELGPANRSNAPRNRGAFLLASGPPESSWRGGCAATSRVRPRARSFLLMRGAPGSIIRELAIVLYGCGSGPAQSGPARHGRDRDLSEREPFPKGWACCDAGANLWRRWPLKVADRIRGTLALSVMKSG
jgi:hypothetical protein